MILKLACVFLAGTVMLAATADAGRKREGLGRGAQFVRRPDASCDGVKKAAIFAHPPWKGAKGRVAGSFDIDLTNAKEPEFTFFAGMQDGHGSKKGAIYRVTAGGQPLYCEHYAQGKWLAQTVSLKGFAGRKVQLVLAVDSLGEFWVNWGEPKVVDGGKVLYDLAGLAGGAGKYIVLIDKLRPDELPQKMRLEMERQARESVSARPTPQQLAWQKLEFIAFAHFGINTFTDREWGTGKEDPKLFNPTDFDARQWAKVLKDAGIRLLILTCKHHDGFCLWPSKYTGHSVKSSPWRGGKGDVVKEVADACREAGLKFGVYLSPWDRNHPQYGNSPVYNEYFKKQLRELLTNYGDVAEVWFDGACGEGPNGRRQEYDWAGYYGVIRECQPNAVIAITGPDVRWVGNEDGVARETEWSVQPARQQIHGREGMIWYPAECDVSIRPGWFYHASQDGRVKPLKHLLDIYYKSVGRNSVLLLNIPPDRRGRIHENDAARLLELRRVLDATFKTDLALKKRAGASSEQPGHPAGTALDGDPDTWWAPAEDAADVSLEVDLGDAKTFDRIMIQEHIALGQRVEEFAVDAWQDGTWREIATGTTIGYKRVLRVKPVAAAKIRLRLLKTRMWPAIGRLGLFKTPDGV